MPSDSLPLYDDSGVPNPLGGARVVKPAVLWIDDDATDLDIRIFALEGVRLECATTGDAGLNMARTRRYDAYLVDLRLPDMYGLSVVERLRCHTDRAPIVVLSGVYIEPESEALARRMGAVDFWHKPIAADKLAQALKHVMGARNAPPPSHLHGAGFTAVDEFHTPPTRFGIVAASQAMQAVIGWIGRVGPTEVPALVTGATGTGKELVARALHAASPRAQQPFVAVNCGAIPDGLRETELFGHSRGAFTGAVQDQKGLIEHADGGTLFLDEIGDLAPTVQVALLRVLENGEVRRVGDTRIRRVNIRVIAATNRCLAKEIDEGHFRKDLYFRLAGVRCHLPSLRERCDDIDALVAYWLPKLAASGRRRVTHIASEALGILRAHAWPGNARELHHVLQSAVCLATGDHLSACDICTALDRGSTWFSPPGPEESSSACDDQQRLLAALEKSRWNRTAAAQLLGINRKTLWRRLRRMSPESSQFLR